MTRTHGNSRCFGCRRLVRPDVEGGAYACDPSDIFAGEDPGAVEAIRVVAPLAKGMAWPHRIEPLAISECGFWVDGERRA